MVHLGTRASGAVSVASERRIEASAGWKAAKEHDHYAALDEASDGDSGYDLRDGTHVERHVGSPRS